MSEDNIEQEKRIQIELKSLDLADAAKSGHLEEVKRLVVEGADIHFEKELPLKQAADRGNLEVVRYLVEQGADFHIGQESPLGTAAENGRLNVVQYLVAQGANIHVLNEWALRQASESGKTEVVRYLIDQGADIHADREDVIIGAARMGQLDTVLLLIERGCDAYYGRQFGSDEIVAELDARGIEGRNKTKMEAIKSIVFLKGFMGQSQISAVADAMRSEEKQYFFNKVVEMEKDIKKMPQSYETDGQGMKAVAHLHYFNSGMDWYITEKDCETEQHQAFGLANLGNGSPELGYISIQELIENGVELDMHFTPQPLNKIMKAKEATTEDKSETTEKPMKYKPVDGKKNGLAF